MSSSGSPSHWSVEERGVTDKDIEDAIERHDYETARLLCERKEHEEVEQQQRETDAAVEYRLQREEEIAETYHLNEDKIEHDMTVEITAIQEHFEMSFDEEVGRQRIEITTLFDEWRDEREQKRKQFEMEAEELMESSKHLARSRLFDEAIAARDKARKMLSGKIKVNLQEIDTKYENRFQAVLNRQKSELKVIKQERDNLIANAKSRMNTLQSTLREQQRVEESELYSECMDVVITNSRSPVKARSIISEFSPRKYPRSEVSSSLLASAVDTLPNSPRSPSRLGYRERDILD